VLEHLDGEDEVEALVREGQLAGVAHDSGHSPPPPLADKVFVVEVDADDAPCRQPRHMLDDETLPHAHVEYPARRGTGECAVEAA
jgi:hypothetical protein